VFLNFFYAAFGIDYCYLFVVEEPGADCPKVRLTFQKVPVKLMGIEWLAHFPLLLTIVIPELSRSDPVIPSHKHDHFFAPLDLILHVFDGHMWQRIVFIILLDFLNLAVSVLTGVNYSDNVFRSPAHQAPLKVVDFFDGQVAGLYSALA
jgi:hypothetical protein